MTLHGVCWFGINTILWVLLGPHNPLLLSGGKTSTTCLTFSEAFLLVWSDLGTLPFSGRIAGMGGVPLCIHTPGFFPMYSRRTSLCNISYCWITKHNTSICPSLWK